MTKKEIQVIEAIRDYTLSLLDGKRHGVAGGCTNPIGEDIYVKTWILPKIEALLDHANNKTKLGPWTYQ